MKAFCAVKMQSVLFFIHVFLVRMVLLYACRAEERTQFAAKIAIVSKVLLVTSAATACPHVSNVDHLISAAVTCRSRGSSGRGVLQALFARKERDLPGDHVAWTECGSRHERTLIRANKKCQFNSGSAIRKAGGYNMLICIMLLQLIVQLNKPASQYIFSPIGTC